MKRYQQLWEAECGPLVNVLSRLPCISSKSTLTSFSSAFTTLTLLDHLESVTLMMSRQKQSYLLAQHQLKSKKSSHPASSSTFPSRPNLPILRQEKETPKEKGQKKGLYPKKIVYVWAGNNKAPGTDGVCWGLVPSQRDTLVKSVLAEKGAFESRGPLSLKMEVRPPSF